MAKIQSVRAREILDSRGNPTLEVEVETDQGVKGRAAVPSGASTGAHEALELRDKDPNRYLGKGVMKALNNVKEIAAPAVIGMDVGDLRKVDRTLLQLDGTDNKSKLGANAILGVSLATAKAGALTHKQELFQFLGGSQAVRLPVPLMNIINGGAHANNGIDIQEFMIVPTCGGSFREALRAGAEIFQTLKKILNDEGHSVAVGDEGGFAPNLKSNRSALEFVMKAIEKAGYKPGEDVSVALDVAATELFKDGRYEWEGQKISAAQLADIYAGWAKDFPLVSIEDGFSEDDWDGWIHITQMLGAKVQLVGDDLFVTNPKRLKDGIARGAANAILIKVNQIGSLSETHEAIRMAKENKYKTVMSHRSGETEDVTISDLAVAFDCEQIKTGSLCRGERTAKYNQLLRIEEILGAKASYWAKQAFK
ncbi:MAG TPA: phosphopyruvate hydratase [Bdellovibrionales bacterium]|nr:phosphopyruvate hydratase [Bdellovibrionales bacterium]